MATIGRPDEVADQFARLGLTPGASLADVKRAYRRLAMDFHPDRAGSSGLRTFLAVKAAYEWIVAHPTSAPPGDLRRTVVRRQTAAHSIRRPTATAARDPREQTHTERAGRGSWPGGRWYWEGILARAALR